MMPYEEFEAWKVSHELALEVYRITEIWPSTERYQLTAQTRRAGEVFSMRKRWVRSKP